MSPCFTRPRFQLGLSSRAPPDSTKGARSTRSIWSWLAFITIYATLQVLQHGHFERCSSRNTLFSCLQLGSFALRQERILGPSDVDIISSLSITKFRLCVGSCKTCGFELLSFVETRHVSFMLQAFRLNDTCRCITTSTSITQSKSYTCGTATVFCTVWVVGTWHHSTTGTSADLDHFYRNLSQSAPGSEGLGCTQFVQQSAINRTLVVDPTISPISSMT